MVGQTKSVQAFTAADYMAKRSALEEQIRVADDDHHRAGYRQLLGEASQDDVDKALVKIGALKAKRRTLDAAWEEVQRRNAETVAQARRSEQQDAASKVDALLATRLDAAAALEIAARALGKAFSDYTIASQRIRHLSAQLWNDHAADKARGKETLSFIQSDIDSGRHVRLLAGLLYEVGVDLSKTSQLSDRFDYREQDGLPAFVEDVNGRIRFRVAELCPDLTEQEEAA